MPIPDGESCAGCRFFVLEDLPMYGNDFGACRRNPPTSDQALMSARPVPPTYWCGEFQPSPPRTLGRDD